MSQKFFKNLIKKKFKDTKIIVEVSGNHQNSFKKLKKLIDKAIEQKVDAVKFQTYTAGTISLNSKNKDFIIKPNKKWKNIKSRYEIYQKAHTPWDWIKVLAKHLNKKKIPWFASPFDETALNFLESINCQAYKIASPEINDLDLIEIISKKKKPVLISTGMASLDDLDKAVKIIKKYNNKFGILKCTSSYPAKKDELDLNLINYLKKRYKCIVGFSDHTVDQEASVVATSVGAKIIEKHFRLDKDTKSIDSHFSMNISEYSNLKKKLLDVDRIIGKKKIFPNKIDKKYLTERRSIYPIKNIRKGEKFTKKNIKSIRPGNSLGPKYYKKLIGKICKRDIKLGSRLSLKDI